MNKLLKKALMAAFALCLVNCGSQPNETDSGQVAEPSEKRSLLEFVDKEHTNIDMVNVIEEDARFNYYMDTYYFNGNGVCLGDINNDGFLDVCIVDMTAADNYRQKVLMAPMTPDLFWEQVHGGAGY